ncbi:MAG TPA: hydroxymethylbilane synthase [Anaerolineae bacterium]|nr:hydroxymethylbilane synthase [Anaerolineae bacterium]HID84127.1 hydroxymethylbilane synthase [Anaerolineales bacterium]HIQ09474.1 hydroxymethylbilane synthase [Anaerolineaceae bacterium]
MDTTPTLVFATRPSALARWQTHWVIRALQDAHPGLTCREEIIVTRGDRVLDRPLPEIGGKGLFTQELEAALLSGRVHAAVHSLKDLPTAIPPSLTVGAVPARAEVRDALVSAHGYTLATLPQGAVVGTSSLRRAAQLLALRPDLHIRPLRGNVDTRVRKALSKQYDAIVLAGAGLTRLGLTGHVTQWLPLEVVLPAPGQGALAVQCRADDRATLRLLQAVDDAATRAAVAAERAFLAALGGGCAVPVAAYAQWVAPERLRLTGFVGATDGSGFWRGQMEGAEPAALGRALAEQALAQGARQWLG